MKYRHQKEKQTGKDNPNYKGGKPKCCDCGKEISYSSKRCMSCNLKLRHKNNKALKKGIIEFSKNQIINLPKCVICGKTVSDYRHRTCSRKCRIIDVKNRKVYTLNNNPTWKGGLSFEPYPLGWNKTFKEQIRYRDGYRCQLCGKPEIENGRKLDIHHIDYDKNNLKQDNLISLCMRCHRKTNFHREDWIQIFKELRNDKHNKSKIKKSDRR